MWNWGYYRDRRPCRAPPLDAECGAEPDLDPKCEAVEDTSGQLGAQGDLGVCTTASASVADDTCIAELVAAEVGSASASLPCRRVAHMDVATAAYRFVCTPLACQHLWSPAGDFGLPAPHLWLPSFGHTFALIKVC